MDLLSDLTTAQRTAVTHGEGPLLILAGPGSGKTRVITRRIAHLIHQGVPAESILAITFTNKASDEMRTRVHELVPDKRTWVSTFHRFCARILREYSEAVGLEKNFTIYDTSDRRAAIKVILKELQLDTTNYNPNRIEKTISRAKNDLLSCSDYRSAATDHYRLIVAQVFEHYQQKLQEANAADFDDLLLLVAQLLKQNTEIRSELDHRFEFVLVDEYQDTNLAQYQIARGLSMELPNLCATGDPDQSIYGWRGANINNILHFERDYKNTTIIRLEQNYRSTKAILRVADHLIRFNQQRKHKSLFTDNDNGAPVQLKCFQDEMSEASSIASTIASEVNQGNRAWSDYAIFYRVNALSRTLELALRKANVPYQIVSGVEFYHRREIKDLLSYLKIIHNPKDDVSFLRIVNVPPRGIGKKTLEHLTTTASEQGTTLLEASSRIQSSDCIRTRQAMALAQFAKVINQLHSSPPRSIAGLIQQLLTDSGYRQSLRTSSDPQDEERLANLEELVTAARQYDDLLAEGASLEGFLEETSLVSDVDNWDPHSPMVTLMTLHAAKGLEFPVVSVIALEQNILPHELSADNPSQLEEERRLLFVGMTRAQQELRLSYAQYRRYRGVTMMAIPSTFLTELPKADLDQDTCHLSTENREVKYQRSKPDSTFVPVHPQRNTNRTPKFKKGRQPTTAKHPAITTADTLLRGAVVRQADPSEFSEGMLITHPQYGLGRIVALQGENENCKATVHFQTSGKRKFLLSQAPLKPIRKRS